MRTLRCVVQFIHVYRLVDGLQSIRTTGSSKKIVHSVVRNNV